MKIDALPNIVILFADNLGYEDVGAFQHNNSGYYPTPPSRTPNIDSLAQDGLKFTNWNSAAHLCSASRATLLTGKYHVRTGIYPGVFKPDAKNGLLPSETTLAEYLKESGYATTIIGKWHLGHRPDYLPTNHGFDEWVGIPYHMSGGSIDNHTCAFDKTETTWLPLYQNDQIIQQPVKVEELASLYASKATEFIHRHANVQPFFLFLPFSHVHQLCAPALWPEQDTCQWAASKTSSRGKSPSFADAVEEMDWIAGQVLSALDQANVANDTLVLFTSDNGPWVAEQACSGQKGPFQAKWLEKNVPNNCTACPHDYTHSPVPGQPRRCVLDNTNHSLDGVHCGSDSGLGSTWEANLRMPSIVRWPGKVEPSRETAALVSTLDVLPTVLSLVGSNASMNNVDGIDISSVLHGNDDSLMDERVLFFWRDGFREGPLPAPFGRVDVVAVKVGRIKAWFWTKSAHYNQDEEVYHDPPLLFDTIQDPAEENPLDPSLYKDLIDFVQEATRKHKAQIDWMNPGPLALERNERYIPCVDPVTGCRTKENSVKVK